MVVGDALVVVGDALVVVGDGEGPTPAGNVTATPTLA